jgi:glycerol-3-phosphate dehydrogenase
MLIGSHHWHPNFFIKLIQHFGIESEVASHLADNYGDRSWIVAAMASATGSRWPIYGARLATGYPFVEGEVRYACRRELACTAVDVVARRTRLAFLNPRACLEALPRVIEIMAIELGWDAQRKKQEYDQAQNYLLSMGLLMKDKIEYPQPSKANADSEEEQARYLTQIHFVPGEIAKYKQIFDSLDYDRDGSVSHKDLGMALSKLGVKMNSRELASVIAEVDLNKSGSVEFNEFLQVLAGVKDIRSRSKFARIVADYQDREQFDSDRSGGGI